MKKLEKLLKKLQAEAKKENCTFVGAISDKNSVQSIMLGTMLDVANLMANFKDNDSDFKMADELSNFMIQAREASESGKPMESDSVASFMRRACDSMEKKSKTDC